VDIVPTRFSEAELTDRQHQIEQELQDVNDGAPVTIDAVADAASGTIEIFVPGSAARTPEQRRWLAAAVPRYGNLLRFEKSPGPAHLD